MTVKPTYEELEKRVRQLEKIKSERKQVEEVLKESESKYRALYENSLEAILLTTQDGNIYAANQVACEILEKSESEIISGGRDRMVNLDDPRLSAALEERYKNGKFNGELTFKKKDGTIFPVELSSRIFHDRFGNEKACIFFRDISERKRAEEALKDSENMFRTIFNLSQQAIGLTEINTGKLVKVNPKLCDLSQYSEKELVGKTTTDLGFYTEKDRKKFIDELKKSGCVDGLEMEFRAKDGSKITALMFANIIKISDLDYILTIFFDLTRLKILEEELIARNKDLLLAQRIAGVGNWSLDPEIGVPVWSEEVYRIYERDMELGPYLLDDCTTIYRDKWWETFRDAIQGAMYEGRPYDIELKLELPSKKEKWIHALCQPHSERGPKGYYLQGTIQDITESKQAEEDLLRERERLASIIEGTNVGTWEWNVQTGETIFNERWAEIIGYSLKEISPVSIDTWMKFTHPDDLKNSGELLQRHFSGELDYYECEARMRHKNGEWIWVLDRGKVAVWTEDGKPLRIMGTHQDITERKQAEDERLHLERKLQQAQKAESLGRMAGAIAHHFNNQLSVVMGNLELVLDDLPDDAENRENLSQAFEAGRKAAEVSQQMLRYLGHISGSQTTINLSDVCRQSLALLQSAFPSGLTLNVDFPGSGPFIHADSGQIQQVLTNLFTNAQESFPDNQGIIGLIIQTVSHEDIPTLNRFPLDWHPQDNPYACLEISDTGCGISKEDVVKIFDPFYTTKFTGRGMGLSVTMGILKTHNGCITVDSEPENGSVFRVYLPVTTEKKPVQHEKVTKPKENVGNGGTVLLIEDEAGVRNTAKIMINRLEYKVIEAQDGVEAVRLFQEHQNEIDCVLSDLTMPRMNGWETLKALREKGTDVPVILASGYDENTVMAGDHPELPQAFLNKPYSMAALKDVLMEVIKLK